jgi:hypothetical protein
MTTLQVHQFYETHSRCEIHSKTTVFRLKEHFVLIIHISGYFRDFAGTEGAGGKACVALSSFPDRDEPELVTPRESQNPDSKSANSR